MAVAVLLAYSGLTALCLAMDRHHRQLWNHSPRRQRVLRFRIAGWSLLAASLLVCCVTSSGWSIGLVAWLGALSAAALLLVFLLPYAPRLAGTLALAAPLAGLLTALIV